MTIKQIYSNLCHYDLRNPNGINYAQDNPEEYGFDKEEFLKLGNFAKKDCACDNCFYRRTELAEYIIELLEDNIKHFEQID